MGSKKLIIISWTILLIDLLPHVGKCQRRDGSPDTEPPSNNPFHRRDPDYDSRSGHVKPMLSSDEELSTDYENFPFDEQRSSSRDIDSIESSNNVNVNVNSYSPLKLPWNQPQQIHRNNRLPNSQYHMNRRKKPNEILPSISMSPNSNFDYNFAHPGGNVRLKKRKKSSKRKSPKIDQKVPSSEEFEISVPSTSGTVCYPIIIQVVKYMQRMEANMKELETKLRPYVLGSQEDSSDDNS